MNLENLKKELIELELSATFAGIKHIVYRKNYKSIDDAFLNIAKNMRAYSMRVIPLNEFPEEEQEYKEFSNKIKALKIKYIGGLK